MFWKKENSNKNFEELNKLVQILQTRISKLEADVDNLILRLRKKSFFPRDVEAKEANENLYKGMLLPE